MGVTRSDLFNSKQNELAAYARVLAHPARIAIIQYLLQSNTCCNSNLVDQLGLAQATISQHLKELKNIGVIQGSVEGVSVKYCINPKQWNHLKNLLLELFETQLPTCAETC